METGVETSDACAYGSTDFGTRWSAFSITYKDPTPNDYRTSSPTASPPVAFTALATL